MVTTDPPYDIQYRRRAEKELTKLPAQIQSDVYDAVEALASDPRPRTSKLLEPGIYRIRVNTSASSYRVIYQVQDSDRLIEILSIPDRKEAYTRRGRRSWR